MTHGIRRYDVRHGAIVLRNTLPYLPVGVHVAVVDPQVGTERRAVALRTGDGRMLVGPDNGLLSLAWERSGGVALAVDVTRSPHRLEPVSATFHGRDVFAPVAAHLAAGAELADAGDPLEPEELERLELPAPREDGGALVAHALVCDRFGNVSLDVDHERLQGSGLRLGGEVEVEVGGRRRIATYAHTFADVAPGRAARVRGRLSHAGARGEPRRRRRDARAWSRTPRSACGPDDRHARASTTGWPTPPTSAPRRWPAPGRRTARWSPPTSRPPGAGVRGAAGSRDRAPPC